MSKTFFPDVFEYIKASEASYRLPIDLNERWRWSMKDHVELTTLYTNSQLKNGKNEYTPVKNITRPILNLQHRTEDIELKDVQIYVDDPDKYHLSFLVKKYHDDVFVQEYDLDTYFDDLNISRIDFGGGLSKYLFKPCPEVVQLHTIAFCNQRDLLGSPFAIKHSYSPDQLLDMKEKGWGDRKRGATHSIEEVITLYHEDEQQDDTGIEIYEVHGRLPKRFADPTASNNEYELQMFIVTFYKSSMTDEKQGVILFTAPENELPFKMIKRDKIQGVDRALGFGGAEELFEPQVWVNYDIIRMQNMLDAASVTILKSTDPTVSAKHPNGLRNLKNMEVIDLEQGTDLAQVDNYPRNMAIFENSLNMWESHAQQMGAANDSIMGENPTAGTPFKLQELVVQESRGLHEYRRGQYAKHIEEIYKDWIIPHIQKKITEGFKWLSELTLDELQYVTDVLKRNAWHNYAKEKILSGGSIEEGEQEAYMAKIEEEFKRGGNKKFIEILKGEFNKTAFGVKVSVAGKNKNLAQMTDKIVNIFRFAFSNPQGFAQTMQIPGMSKAFNDILEFSGMSPVDFSGIDKVQQEMQQQMPQQGQLPAQQPINA